jgi:hypothetical protein
MHSAARLANRLCGNGRRGPLLKPLGLTVPPSVLALADEVIE